MKKFNVVECTAKADATGYVLTIESRIQTELFGIKQWQKERYCLSSIEAVAIGHEINVDFAEVDVVGYEWMTTMKDRDGNDAVDPETGELVLRKAITRYLHKKRSA